MRSGIWMLAICGTIGLTVQVSIAQDRSDAIRRYRQDAYETSRRSRPLYFSRYRRNLGDPSPESEQSSLDTRNDRQERGRMPTVPSTETAPSRYRSDSTSYGARLNSLPRNTRSTTELKESYRNLLEQQSSPSTETERSQLSNPYSTIRQAGYEASRSSETESDNPFAEALSDSRADEDSRVIHAEHQQYGGSRDRGNIQPIRAAEENVNPFNLPAQVSTTDSRDRATRPDIRRRLAANSDRIVGEDTGPQTPSVTVEWIKKGEINVGQECRFDLIVKNTGRTKASQVAVDAYFPTSVRLTKVEPEPAESRDHVTWEFAALQPGEQQLIQISLIPSERGELGTTAYVRFTGSASALFKVTEPLLKLAMKGPEEVMIGDSAAQTIMVSNPGTGVVRNVTIEALIPEGLEHIRGERLVTEIGSLNPGESRPVRLSLAAVGPGKQTIQVTAKSESDLQQTTATDVHVIAPNLKVVVQGPDLRYVGRNASYTIVVTNEGSAPSNNVRVNHRLPAGFQFVKADQGGKHDPTTNIVQWYLGQLDPGTSRQVAVEVTATELGKFSHHIHAFSEYGATADAKVDTHVQGTASLVLEMVDLDDPVEVGTETAYEIRVRNDGSIAARNLEVTCQLPQGVELIDVKGPVGHSVERGTVAFRAIDGLQPGKTAIYRIHIRGQVDGNHRCRAQLTSDSIQDPLTFEELTKFYAD